MLPSTKQHSRNGESSLLYNRLRTRNNISMNKHMAICTENNSIIFPNSFGYTCSRTPMQIPVIKRFWMMQNQSFKSRITTYLAFANRFNKLLSLPLIVISSLVKLVILPIMFLVQKILSVVFRRLLVPRDLFLPYILSIPSLIFQKCLSILVWHSLIIAQPQHSVNIAYKWR